jgi:phosphoribosylformylglycinamidine (FGAM) synthase-like enzyme
LLFGESQSRIVISVAPHVLDSAVAMLKAAHIPHSQIGRVTRGALNIRVAGDQFRWSIAELYDDWFNAIARAAA